MSPRQAAADCQRAERVVDDRGIDCNVWPPWLRDHEYQRNITCRRGRAHHLPQETKPFNVAGGRGTAGGHVHGVWAAIAGGPAGWDAAEPAMAALLQPRSVGEIPLTMRSGPVALGAEAGGPAVFYCLVLVLFFVFGPRGEAIQRGSSSVLFQRFHSASRAAARSGSFTERSIVSPGSAPRS